MDTNVEFLALTCFVRRLAACALLHRLSPPRLVCVELRDMIARSMQPEFSALEELCVLVEFERCALVSPLTHAALLGFADLTAFQLDACVGELRSSAASAPLPPPTALQCCVSDP